VCEVPNNIKSMWMSTSKKHKTYHEESSINACLLAKVPILFLVTQL
jgi:hypothetical protein